jgi:hypothetical protein
LSDYAEEIIEPQDFVNRKILQMKIVLERTCEVLLTGTVYNEQNMPVKGAVVEVTAVCFPNHRVKMGYILTNQEGEFTIAVEKNDFINYLIHIYEPLING